MKVNKGGSFKPVKLPEPQTALARCYAVIEIGHVPNIYKGQQKGLARKLYINWEFPTLKAVFNEERGEEPFVIGLEVTASTGDNSNLSKLISQWRNKPLDAKEQANFDPTTMIGKTAYISFLHRRKPSYATQEITEVTNENTNLKFNGIMPKPKEIQAPNNINPYIIWDWDKVQQTGFSKNIEQFEKIPMWLRRKIAESTEFKSLSGGYKIEKGDDEQAEGNGTQQSQAAPQKTSEDDW